MAAIEETSLATVVAGALPDSVEVDPRVWRLAPFRPRDPAPPDYSDAGLDLYLKGDPAADGDPVTVIALADSVRNGAKRVLADTGDPALWAEPSPRSFDTWGTSSGTLGVATAAAGPVDTEISLGVAASHIVSNSTDFPYVVRAVVALVGCRFESPLATFRADVTATLNDGVDDVVSTFSRDMFYGYGGSTNIILPAVTVVAGGSFTLEADLVLVYRAIVPTAFAVSVVGCQVGLQVVESTSLGDI